MSGFDYSRSKATADRLIKRFGMTATLLVPKATGSKFDPTSTAPDEHPVLIVLLDYLSSEVDGDRVLASDKKVLIAKADLAVDPLPGHRLSIAGVEHRLIGPDVGRGVSKIAPGGVTVLYEAQARV